MQQFKPWHAILVLLAVGAVVFGVMSLLGGGVKRASSITMIDVTSGELFRADVSGARGLVVPAKHPDTGERTLVLIVEDDSGIWKVDMSYVTDDLRSRGIAPGIDLNSGEITMDVTTSSMRTWSR